MKRSPIGTLVAMCLLCERAAEDAGFVLERPSIYRIATHSILLQVGRRGRWIEVDCSSLDPLPTQKRLASMLELLTPGPLVGELPKGHEL